MTLSTTTFRRLVLAISVTLALALRLVALDTYGFSEDETAKLRAIDAYRRGEFSLNAEHPMLMKLAMWGSLSLAGQLRHWQLVDVSDETALRLPNVLAGTATVAAVYGVSSIYFGSGAGLLAAAVVAVDPNVIAVNRIGKEDTLLVLFFFVAVWCYERGKQVGVVDPWLARRRWYMFSGAVFGLMLASKYMPHLFGLYALFNVVAQRDAGLNSPDRRRYFGAMGAAFVVTNFAILLPATWAHCLDYIQGHQLAHHGIRYAGQLYTNNSLLSPDGVPVTYYVRMLATKVPLPVLAGAIAGLVPLVRRRHERGYAWMRILLIFILIGYSLAASKFQRYALPMLVLIDILAAVGLAWVLAWLWSRPWPVRRRTAVAALMVAGVVGTTLVSSMQTAPFYSLHQNLIGRRLAPPATLFPEEAYDFGVREAVAAIAAAAPPDAAIVSDAPGVVSHYLARSGRTDLEVIALSRSGRRHRGTEYVLAQEGHIYFENAEDIAILRRFHHPWREYRLGPTPVLQVFHLPG